MQVPKLKREWTSLLTGDLSTLLPQQVGPARLVHTTNSGDAIDASRTNNPTRDQDRILGEYSDGTVVLILRYDSPEAALFAMDKKNDNEYSSQALRQRGETDPSFSADNITAQHGSTGSDIKTSSYANVQIADREIQQWWNLGWSWWKPASWNDEGGWSGRLLYIVEGYRASAAAYKSAFESKPEPQGGLKIQPMFPVFAVADVLDNFMILAICAGVIGVSLSTNNYALMQIATRRRNIFLMFVTLSWSLSILVFMAPEFMSTVITSAGVLVVVMALLALVSVLLIMGLMRKAAKTFTGVGPS